MRLPSTDRSSGFGAHNQYGRRSLPSIMCGLAAACVALVLTACDWGPHKSVTAPSEDPSLTAWITAPRMTGPDTTVLDHVIPFQCSANLQFTGPLDITLTAVRDVELHDVIIQLLTESFAGAPANQASTVPLASGATNTFSDGDLESAFGSRQLPGGTVKTLRFRTNLPCPNSAPDAVAASIRFKESSGQKNTVTVTAPFETEVLSNNGRALTQ